MFGRLAQGLEIVARACVTPLLLGARWASHAHREPPWGVPTPGTSLRLLSKMALDEVFFATELVTGPVAPLGDRRRAAREITDALALYDERGWLDQPPLYHQRPPPLIETRREKARSLWSGYGHLRFESGYRPHPDEPGAERWLGYRPTRTAHAWLLEHRGPERPWLVCIPGYRMGHPLIDLTGLRARWLHRALGLNVAIPVLPLHGPRSVGRRGGDGFLSGDFLDTVHAQSQAVWDVRRLVGWLRVRSPAVGLYGISLGAHTAALVASLERRVDCVIAGIPAADVMRLILHHLPPLAPRGLSLLGLSMESIQRLLRVISPLAFAPLVPFERRFLYAALADRLATPDHARDLWHHWGRPELAWYPGSHVSFLWERTVRTFLERAVRLCELTDSSPRPLRGRRDAARPSIDPFAVPATART